jgi:disulfide bond formation protein DsbB
MSGTNVRSDTTAAEAKDDHRRRWYHPRPQPRRRSDLMGFNSAWWLVVAFWIPVILLIVWPFPVW